MKIKHGELDIPADDPFKNDPLHRKEIASVLTNLVRSVDDPFVLAINAPWGEGKTTFLRMWRHNLTKEGFPTLYFNAWENDFVEDPIIAFMGEIRSGIDLLAKDAKHKTTLSKKFEKVTEGSISIAKRAAPMLAKLLTANALDLEKLAEAAIVDTVGKLVSDRIESYEKDKTSMSSFRAALEEFATTLSSGTGQKVPTVFFVDELDRCRPIFSVQLLERLKHLFAVKGIVFVLGVAMDQLGHSIKALYGTGFDADQYLRRFIDMEFRLPTPDGHAFVDFLMQRFGFDSFFSTRSTRFPSDRRDFAESFAVLAAASKLSLREQEQCFTRFSVIFRTATPVEQLHPIFLVALTFLRLRYPEIYQSFSEGRLSGNDAVNVFRTTLESRQHLGGELGAILRFYFEVAMQNENDFPNVVRNKEAERGSPIGAAVFKIAKKLLDENQQLGPRLLKKIEMSENFS